MDMSALLQQARDFQEKIKQVQEELANRTVTGTAGGGMVTVTANGRQEVLTITIDPEVVDPADAVMLQDLIVAAVNDALRKSREMMKSEMASLTGGMQIPGLFP